MEVESNKETSFISTRNCSTCKNMWAPMYNGPCKDCIHNSCLNKSNQKDRWEPKESK